MTAKNRATLNSDADSALPDNSAGEISPSDVRTRVKDLADSAVLHSDISGNGVVSRTASGTYVNRTVTGTSNEITVSNGDGVSGNPTLALASAVKTSLGKADTALQSSAIGSTVQGFDADTAKTDVAQTWTAAQQFGQVTGTVTAVPSLNLDCSAGNDFTKTIAGSSTFTVSNVPSSKAFDLRLLLTYTSGTITWFSGVNWAGGSAPTLTGGKVYELIFTTFDGGTTWRAAAGEYAA